MKHFQLEGIDYYVSAPSKELAVIACLRNRWGVTAANLVEIERIPANASHVATYK